MAHYAFITDGIVTEVITGKDETETIEGLTPEEWYGNFRAQKCVRTSYNGNIRGVYAGIADSDVPALRGRHHRRQPDVQGESAGGKNRCRCWHRSAGAANGRDRKRTKQRRTLSCCNYLFLLIIFSSPPWAVCPR